MFGSSHRERFQVVLADGFVCGIDNAIPPNLFQALGNIIDGLEFDAHSY